TTGRPSPRRARASRATAATPARGSSGLHRLDDDARDLDLLPVHEAVDRAQPLVHRRGPLALGRQRVPERSAPRRRLEDLASDLDLHSRAPSGLMRTPPMTAVTPVLS